MDPRFGAFNVTTGVLLALTIWVLVARFRSVVESNWPLFFYLGVIIYSTIYRDVLDPAWVYAGVVCSLLMRFEFMGGFFLRIIQVIDILVLGYIVYVALSSLAF